MRCKHFLEDNQIFEKHPAFCQLPQLVISHLRSVFRPLIFTEGNIIIELDKPQHYCICVIEGTVRDYHTGKIVANGSIYGLEHYLADDPSSSSTTWKQTLEAISPRATCACISLRDMQACLGEDFLPVLIKRSRAYFYNLGRTSTITKNLDDISASHAPSQQNLQSYRAIPSTKGRLLANPVLPSTVSKILERVRWTQREHSLHALRRITKKILQSSTRR